MALLLSLTKAAERLSRKRDGQIDQALGAALEAASGVIASTLGVASLDHTYRRDSFRLGQPVPTSIGDDAHHFWLTSMFVGPEDVVYQLQDPSGSQTAIETTYIDINRDKGLVHIRNIRAWGPASKVLITYNAGFQSNEEEGLFYVYQDVPGYLEDAALTLARILLADNPRYAGDKPTSGPILDKLRSVANTLLLTHSRIASSRYLFAASYELL